MQKGIDALLKGRTSFIIAHRLSTIRKADRIFVIDQGNILEDVMTAYRDAYRRVRKLEEERFFEGDKEEVSKQLN